jgi:RND superfamily putative drug exporter
VAAGNGGGPAARPPWRGRRAAAGVAALEPDVQARPWPLAIVSLAVMVVLLVPVFAMRLDSKRRRQRPGQHQLAPRVRSARAGVRRRVQRPAAARRRAPGPIARALAALRAAVSATPDVVAVTPPRIAPSGTVAVIQAYPDSAPQAVATTNLVNHLRDDVLPRSSAAPG